MLKGLRRRVRPYAQRHRRAGRRRAQARGLARARSDVGRAAQGPHPDAQRAVRLPARRQAIRRCARRPLRRPGIRLRKSRSSSAMRIAVVGAGPAGLFFSLLLKRKRPEFDITVIEQNPRDATFGFGVVFSRGALEFLARDEPQMHATLTAAFESWPVQRIVHRDAAVDIDGNGFSAIGRLDLLRILQGHCEGAGVRLAFNKAFSPEEFKGSDLIVAADGANSALRRLHEKQFKPNIEILTNKFAWYGTTKPFECLTLTFRESGHGFFVARHYRHARDMSTFVVECEGATWTRAGLGRMREEESCAY